MADLAKGDIVYWARVIPKHHIYDVYELKLRTVTDRYVVGCDVNLDNPQAYDFGINQLGKVIFKERGDALKLVLEAQEQDDGTVGEKCYEEY